MPRLRSRQENTSQNTSATGKKKRKHLAPDEDDDGKWSCRVCTLKNGRRRRKCAACETWRIIPQSDATRRSEEPAAAFVTADNVGLKNEVNQEALVTQDEKKPEQILTQQESNLNKDPPSSRPTPSGNSFYSIEEENEQSVKCDSQSVLQYTFDVDGPVIAIAIITTAAHCSKNIIVAATKRKVYFYSTKGIYISQSVETFDNILRIAAFSWQETHSNRRQDLAFVATRAMILTWIDFQGNTCGTTDIGIISIGTSHPRSAIEAHFAFSGPVSNNLIIAYNSRAYIPTLSRLTSLDVGLHSIDLDGITGRILQVKAAAASSSDWTLALIAQTEGLFLLVLGGPKSEQNHIASLAIHSILPGSPVLIEPQQQVRQSSEDDHIARIAFVQPTTTRPRVAHVVFVKGSNNSLLRLVYHRPSETQEQPSNVSPEHILTTLSSRFVVMRDPKSQELVAHDFLKSGSIPLDGIIVRSNKQLSSSLALCSVQDNQLSHLILASCDPLHGNVIRIDFIRPMYTQCTASISSLVNSR